MLLKNIAKSLGAVLAGFIAIVMLSVVTDSVLEQRGVLPRENLFGTGPVLLALTYRIAYSVIGCYIAARLAPNRPMAHALALGVLGIVVSALGSMAARDLAPAWYVWALILVSLPCAWVGGQWASRGKVSART